jgi:membrane-associated phospholipid phosphatase
VILAVLLVVSLALARVGGFGASDLDKMAGLVWAAIGAVLAFGVSLPVVHLVGRARPFAVMPQAVVLVTRPAGFSFPNEHAVIAGAFATGLWLSRTRLMAAAATLVALVIALAVVYTGTAYPGDAAAGLLLGTLVSVVVYPFAIGSLRALLRAVARSPLKFLVGGGPQARPVGPGPAARPEMVGESGAVRILPPDGAGTIRILPPDHTGTGPVTGTGRDGTGRD